MAIAAGPKVPIDRDATGSVIASGPMEALVVWTNTGADGASRGVGCANWTSTQPTAQSAGVGRADDLARWSSYLEDTCDRMHRVYCFGI